jgi:hypothetical protein
MSTSLTVLGQSDIQKGGLGLGSKIFQLKPSTIELVQAMSKAEGAVPGKLRISDTGQHYDEMQVVMLFEPTQQRSYFEGEEFSKDSKICFSLDNVEPHSKAKIAQAPFCKSCPKASWEKYRQTKLRSDLPKCREYWHLVLADRVTQLPYYLNVKGTSIPPFEQKMGAVAKMIGLMQAQAQAEDQQLVAANPGDTDLATAVAKDLFHPLRAAKPNIFDISFKIRSVKPSKSQVYMLDVFDIAPLKKEDRPKFGAIFLDFANRKANNLIAAEGAEAEAAAAETSIPSGVIIDAAVIEAPTSVAGEIVI